MSQTHPSLQAPSGCPTWACVVALLGLLAHAAEVTPSHDAVDAVFAVASQLKATVCASHLRLVAFHAALAMAYQL